MSKSLINIEGLIKRFPMGNREFTALNGVDLKIGQGEFSGLVGPSGSGKTTILNIVGSLDIPTEGTVNVLGNDIGTLTAKTAAKLRNKHIGFIFQTYNLLPVYTVYENVELPLLLLGYDKASREKMIMDALEWVDLIDKRDLRPSTLSGGESQRVAVARAMVKRPEIVLADEPTANLDSKNSFNILEMMVDINKELKTTFIFATHDEKVMKYLKRKISLIDGKIAKDELIK
ncbi:MAG: lipoprotein-releasing system ATP-binding protein LolD [Candidatus Neomarinimicrobiota bacterium]|nr:MAG: lipoprotein-releasing system ATP-binding protein LolD [Candidatus Neomarinimicrobiota bacterium]